MPRATAHTETVLRVARVLLGLVAPLVELQGLTLVGLSVTNFDDRGAMQLVLPFDSHSGDALDATLDEVRERFGTTAVTRAVLLGRDQGFSVPMLPD
jgi:DNA polymerase-4